MTRNMLAVYGGMALLGTACVSYGLAWLSSRLAFKIGAVDEPRGGRKIHTRRIPLLGGVGIGVVLLAFIALGTWQGWFTQPEPIRLTQMIGFAVALLLILVVGIWDDRSDISAAFRLSAYTVAALIILLTGTGIIQVTKLGGQGAFSLVWWQHVFVLGSWHPRLSLPADLLTVVWLVVVMFATKFSDGLDGLVTGQTIVGTLSIAALTLSSAYYQPGVAFLALGTAGAFLGFLPHNIHPARQFLGESGSVIAGFCLAFLAIVSGAKVAMTLAIIAVPLADIAMVMLGRWRRGVPMWQGDDTHIHFRLLRAGLSHRAAVAFLWSISFVAGIGALFFQTRGKIFLIFLLLVLGAVQSWVVKPRS